MKSMLHEASSVAKAIEKAWADAGNPTEFTIKVLETGKKNFLGMSKTPAVVSITYEPRRQPVRPQDSGRQLDRRAQQPGNSPAKQPVRQANVINQNQVRPLPKKEAEKLQPVRPAQANQVVREPERAFADQGEFLAWQDEWVAFVSGQLKELLGFWGSKQEFTTKADKRTLIITLDAHLHDDPTEERNVFMGFSYLLMQFFKRNYKKKFRGFQVLITTKNNTP